MIGISLTVPATIDDALEQLDHGMVGGDKWRHLLAMFPHRRPGAGAFITEFGVLLLFEWAALIIMKGNGPTTVRRMRFYEITN